ncbi:class II fructose-bisphosphatase [Salinicoccus halodurans]|uniref:Fructose-1,6-bisphosphatase n=1 Tax=Salinicoccus halodurans TaxID=407035 RepID=A0A0F7HIZ3_9STAP|nr:class II fructose-bisphosphatase [Salinicoccus halodurans]AKG73502.1 fructose 1,6-bisphosphatase [Salinicoccus halodurans]SFK51672.1 fructose-1,6-bisphosphatase II [Salinicoccus halodurans]
MQSLALEFLKVTESAAISAFPWIGRGNKIAADDAATTAMRDALNQVPMEGTIVIGEGEIDEAPMLFIGEKLGRDEIIEVDIAVDPIEGTTPTANGQENAITVIAAAPKGTLLHAPDMYMEKMAVGPKAKGKINVEAPLIDNLKMVAEANGKDISELNVAVQDRPRHAEYIDTIRKSGAKVQLFKDGDVLYAAATCMEHIDIDMFLGVGGAPEGVLSAVAIRALGGELQARLKPRDDGETDRCKKMGIANPEGALTLNHLVCSDEGIFVATGLTDSFLLNGIKCNNGEYKTHSILIDGKENQLRFIESQYNAKPAPQTI